MTPPAASAPVGNVAHGGGNGYDGAVNGATDRMEIVRAGYGDAITDAQQSLIDAIYNATVEAMEGAAAEYNAALQAFRARQDG